MNGKLKIAIIGGGSVFTPELVYFLGENAHAIGKMEVAMTDIDSEKQKTVAEMCQRILAKQKKDIPVSCFDSADKAVEGADFIVLQFRQGGQEARIEDERLGIKYKIPFVETVSVCGFSTFLRTYYEMEKIASIIKEKAPDAWVANFTNPAGQLTEALYGLGISKVFGICNGWTYTIRAIADLMGIPQDELSMNWTGLNHMTFIDAVYHQGKDILQDIIERLDDSGRTFPFPKGLLKRLGVIPNSYLQYFYRREYMVKKLQGHEKLRSEQVKEINAGLIGQYASLDYLPDELKNRGGYGYSKAVVNVLRGICCDEGSMHYAVVKNNSVIPELPEDTFIESSVVAKKEGLFPVMKGRVPRFARSLLVAVKDYERLSIEGAKNRDKNLLFQALMVHPLIGCYEIAEPLLEDCLDINREFIPEIGK